MLDPYIYRNFMLKPMKNNSNHDSNLKINITQYKRKWVDFQRKRELRSLDGKSVVVMALHFCVFTDIRNTWLRFLDMASYIS